MSIQKSYMAAVTGGNRPLKTYHIGRNEEFESAVVEAFSSQPINEDVQERDPLYEWVDLEQVRGLFESARDDIEISTTIWGRKTVLSPAVIEIY